MQRPSLLFIGVFLGFATSDAYSSPFKVMVVLLSAVGLIVTPIYLLSMLREIFYGEESKELKGRILLDAKPREVFITACLLLPVISIGLYPKLLTQMYDAKTVEIANHVRSVASAVAHQPLEIFSQFSEAPRLMPPSTPELLGIVK